MTVSSDAPVSVPSGTVASTSCFVTATCAEPVRSPASCRLSSEPETANASDPVRVTPEPGTVAQSIGVAPAPLALFRLTATCDSAAEAIVPNVSEPLSSCPSTASHERVSVPASVSSAIVSVEDGPPSVIASAIETLIALNETTKSEAPVRLGEATSTVVLLRSTCALPEMTDAMPIVTSPPTWRSVAAVTVSGASVIPVGWNVGQFSFDAPVPVARFSCSRPPVSDSVTSGTPTSETAMSFESTPSQDFPGCEIETTCSVPTEPERPTLFATSPAKSVADVIVSENACAPVPTVAASVTRPMSSASVPPAVTAPNAASATLPPTWRSTAAVTPGSCGIARPVGLNVEKSSLRELSTFSRPLCHVLVGSSRKMNQMNM